MINLSALVLEKLNTGIIVVDKNQSIVIWNNWLERYSGKNKNETLGLALADVCPRLALEPYQQMLRSTLFVGQSRFCSGALHNYFVEPVGCMKDKQHIRQNMQIEPIFIDDKIYALIQITDITNQYSRVKGLHEVIRVLESENEQVKRSEQILQHQAFHDSLTGLTNRALFDDRLVYILHHAEQHNLMFALMFLDLDGFKQVNDSLGHLAGDELLKAVSDRMKKCIRKTDTLARLGGDEFAVILSQISEREDAERIADKFLQSLRPLFDYKGKPVSITVSIGIAVYPFDGDSPEQLLKIADEAMYSAKSLGKDSFCFYRNAEHK